MAIEQTIPLESKPATTALASASVIVLQGAETTRSELNAAKLVEFMGGEVAFVRLPENGGIERLRDLIPRGAAIIAQGGALAAAMVLEPDCVGWLASLMSFAERWFIFGFEADSDCDRLLHELTGGVFRAIEKLPSRTERLDVTTEQAEICRQLCGLTFDVEVRASDSVFVSNESGASAAAALIRLGGKPQLVKTNYRSAELLLAASGEIADLDDSPEGRAPLAGYFSQIAPLLMFLRRLRPEEYWHNESPRACLIIDDPLLKPRYGYLEFEKLLALMRQESFSTSIAFIPWNHRRSRAHVVELFRRFPAHFSMCIHGCDHTGGEFASTDSGFLRAQAARGLLWMARHRESTGVGFDDVMVFPQGRFSTVAMAALQSCGYLAAVNSTARPIDGDGSTLQLRDLLDVAVTRFDGFPLFVRHYPSDVAGLGLALFLGKPALLVEHHGYFKDGYESLARIVRMLRRMEPRLEWTSLSTICSRACWSRKSGSGEILVRFYADRFELHNDTSAAQRYLLQYQRDGEVPACIRVDGAPADRMSLPEGSVARVDLAAGKAAIVEVCREREPVANALRQRAPSWCAKVAIRRHLSELRDDHLEKHPSLRRVAARVRKRLFGGA